MINAITVTMINAWERQECLSAVVTVLNETQMPKFSFGWKVTQVRRDVGALLKKISKKSRKKSI